MFWKKKKAQVPSDYCLNIDVKPINNNASSNAKKLLRFLGECYGKKILTGQYVNSYDSYLTKDCYKSKETGEFDVFLAKELQAVHSVTREYPAVLGLDLLGIVEGWDNASVEQAIKWHENGGIVTLCWHWGKGIKKPREFYTKRTDFSLKKALKNKNSALYKGLIEDIDMISKAIKPLCEKDVPVLWRPLHEASGGWFWWGHSGAKAYKELWQIMYDRMVNYHRLDNLLWVWNGQNPKWYVGDDMCDIIGDDPYYMYNKREYYEKDVCNKERFAAAYNTSKSKIIAMSENDFVPDIDSAFAENSGWVMFATWARDFVCKNKISSDGTPLPFEITEEYNERCTTVEELRQAYENPASVTLSQLREIGYRAN